MNTVAQGVKDIGLKDAIRIDQGMVEDHLGEVVRSTVEHTLNGLLDAEAERLCNARRYERTPDRQDTRAGHYQRKLQTGRFRLSSERFPLRSESFQSQSERVHSQSGCVQ